jgi:hypothetical protein
MYKRRRIQGLNTITFNSLRGLSTTKICPYTQHQTLSHKLKIQSQQLANYVSFSLLLAQSNVTLPLLPNITPSLPSTRPPQKTHFTPKPTGPAPHPATPD